MKTKSIILALCGTFMSLTASAQFANTGGSGSVSTHSSEGWSSLYVQYNPTTLSLDIDDADDYKFTGFSVGYNKAWSISQSMPLFIEGGIGLQYSKYSDEESDEIYYEGYYFDTTIERKISVFSLKVPVSLVYNLQIPNSSVSISPYAGITLRYNISGKYEYGYTISYGGESESDSEDADLFDDSKDEMGDDAWERFQLGWQIGANVKFNNSIYAGLAYGSDFSEICEKGKLSTISISLGYCF